jgi:hypothetical protein
VIPNCLQAYTFVVTASLGILPLGMLRYRYRILDVPPGTPGYPLTGGAPRCRPGHPAEGWVVRLNSNWYNPPPLRLAGGATRTRISGPPAPSLFLSGRPLRRPLPRLLSDSFSSQQTPCLLLCHHQRHLLPTTCFSQQTPCPSQR